MPIFGRKSHPSRLFLSARPAVCTHGHRNPPSLLAAGGGHPLHAGRTDDHHSRHRRAQDTGHAFHRMDSLAAGRSLAPQSHGESGRRHGYGFGRICRKHLQARHGLYQHPHHPAQYGRCQRGRQNRHQLRRTEERDWCIQLRTVRTSGHHLPAHT